MFERRELAENIAQRRRQMGLSQSELAQRLYISAQSVSKWEHGDALPDIANLCKLAEIFRVSVDVLLGQDRIRSAQPMMIGIDGGGTKTEFVLFDASSCIHDRVVLDATNPNVCGMDRTCTLLKEGIDRLLLRAGRVKGIFAGVAGFGSGKNRPAVMAFLTKQYPNIAIRCDTDIWNVLGNLPHADRCVTAICGTGCVVYGYADGQLHRAGGWGYLLDDGGNGYALGRDALRAALAARDGFADGTVLTELVEKQLGGTVWENISAVYAQGSGYIASFAPLVFEAHAQGDAVAAGILERNFAHLAYLINQAIRLHDCGDTLLIAGGLMHNQNVILPLLREKLDSPMRILVPTLPQIYGACIQCCKLCGIDTAGLEANFENEYNKIVRK